MYFIFTAQNLPDDSKAQYTERASALLDVSVSFAGQKVTLARVGLEKQRMTRELDSDWSNFSILMNKHHYACVDFSQDMSPRIKHWLDEYGAKLH